MVLDLSKVKLGRLPKKVAPRLLKMSAYRTELPVVPQRMFWDGGYINWGMMGNDTIGDCTCAGFGHAAQTWTQAHGKIITPTDADVIGMYTKITGFNPATGANDNGAALTDVVDYVTKNGFAGMSLAAAVEVDHTNIQQVKEAIDLFGGVYTGFNVPQSIEGQSGTHWSITDSSSQIVGGHCVYFVDYDDTDDEVFTCVSWGSLYTMDKPFFTTYFDETIGLISSDWVSPSMLAPNQFNYQQLIADCQALGPGIN